MSRKQLAHALFVLLLLGGGACGGGDDDSTVDSADSGSASTTSQAEGDDGGEAVGEKVAVRDDLFEPAEVAIAVGDSVTWEWEGENPHNVQGSDFKTPIQKTGTFKHTFKEAGTFEYVCQVHPSMKASVVVADG